MRAPSWSSQRLPQRFQLELRRRLALRGGLRERGVHADIPPTPLAREAIAAATSFTQLRVLVLFAGGGGASTGIAACSAFADADVTAVELRDDAAAIYAANHPRHRVLQLDLSDVAAACARLRALGPFDLVQWSPPCVDFSRSGRGIEGPAAELTVHAATIIANLQPRSFVMENVARTLASDAWRRASTILRAHGYAFRDALVDARDCGVPQRRKRIFVAGAIGATDEALIRFVAVLTARQAAAAALPPPSLADIAGVGAAVYLHARRESEPCVWAATGVAPTLRTTCARFVRPSRYRMACMRVAGADKRPRDAAPLDTSMRLSRAQLGAVAGFPADYSWPGSRAAVGRAIGNAVAPPVMTAVLEAALTAGIVPSRHAFRSAPPLRYPDQPIPLPSSTAAAREFPRDSWVASAAAAREHASARPRRPRGAVAQAPSWALHPPRQQQHPRVATWRTECVRRGITPLTAREERLGGLGDRDAPADTRPVISPSHPDIAAARDRIARGEAFTGLSRPVTGWPNACADQWVASGANAAQERALRDGYTFEPSGVVPPVGIGGPGGDGNSPSCYAPEHAAWLRGVICELLLLGVIRETSTRNFVTCPLSVVAKAGWDPVTAPHRLRLILDQRSLNVFLNPPRFSMESLEQARPVFERDDDEVLLTYDISAQFWHWAASESDRPLMGCSLGGRHFEWLCTPMGTSTSPYLCTSLIYILARRWRRLGIRLAVVYCDDYCIACKRSEVPLLSAFLRDEFRRHGLLVNWAKSDDTGSRRARVLGLDVDLDSWTYSVPQDKKDKICAGLDAVIADAEAGREVSVRTCAQSVGRIMATAAAVGPVARRMTRASYHFIARVTGVPPDATRRDLRVAWNRRDHMPADALAEFRLWREMLPTHTGSAISAESPRATVVLSADAGDVGWGGNLDAGAGIRHYARDVFAPAEAASSSTERELHAAERNMRAFERILAGLHGQHVLLLSDSQSAVRALEVGSKRPHLHAICNRIFRLAMRHSLVLHCRWRRRDRATMSRADDGSKFPDTCDYQLDPRQLRRIERALNVTHTCDVFAATSNALLPRFFSRHGCPGAAAVDAFAQDLGLEAECWMHPPRARIGQAIQHLRNCGGSGTILVPLNTREVWWPLVGEGARGTSRGARVRIHRADGILRRAGAVPLRRGRFDLIAVRLDFRGHRQRAQAHPMLRARAAISLLLRRQRDRRRAANTAPAG